MINEIKKPEPIKYYIVRNNENKIMAYGVVEQNQQMQTGQPIMDTYLNEIDWQNVLLDEGIELEEEGSHGFAGVNYQNFKV